MPDTKTAKSRTAKSSGRKGIESEGWTEEERAAMQERAKELKLGSRGKKAAAADPLAEMLAKIAELPDDDRVMAERIHAIVLEAAPELQPKTWYGMPAYYKDGKALCFFTPAAKFKERYATFGFNAGANLDDGSMWPTSWALTRLTPADEKRLADLVKKAAS